MKTDKPNFNQNFIEYVKMTDPKMWMVRMKKLGMAQYQKENVMWRFENKEKDDQTLTEKLCQYFVNISNHFLPWTGLHFIPVLWSHLMLTLSVRPEEDLLLPW